MIKTLQEFYWVTVNAYFEDKKQELSIRLKDKPREDTLYFVSRVVVKRALQTYLPVEELKNFDRNAVRNKLDKIDEYVNRYFFVWYLIFSSQSRPACDLERDFEDNSPDELEFKFSPELATH
jgi:hypothetical protein